MAPPMANGRRSSGANLAALALPVVIGVLLVTALLVATVRTAEAHANLVRSIPAAGAVLERGPEYVEIEFSERIAPAQSDVRVFNVRGERVDLDDLQALDDGPLTLRVGVRSDLPDGTYTVSWQNLSDVDGHSRTGGFVFFIGEAGLVPTIVNGDEPSPLIRPADAAARWAALVGLALLGGVPWAYRLVFASRVPAEERGALDARLRRITLVGGAAVLVAAAAQLALKLAEVGGGAPSLVLDTRWGNAWLLRVLLASAAIVIWWAAHRGVPTAIRRLAIPLALGAALTVSSASHGAAASGFGLVAGLIDATHVLATMAWGGGLVVFLAVLATSRRERAEHDLLRSVLPRFTVLGALATLTLAVTGTYAAWVHAGSIEALSTDYGRGIVVKVLLLGALVAIAAVNTTWVRRRLAERNEVARGASWLRRLVRVEVVLIALVLAATGVMTSTAPARQQVDDGSRARGLVTQISDSGVDIEVTVNPARVGLNEVTVVIQRDGEPYDDVAAVELRTRNLETAFGTEDSFLTQRAPGEWTSVRPTVLTIDGLYEFSLRIQRDDGLDLLESVRFDTTATREVAGLGVADAWRIGLVVLSVVGLALIAANAVGSRVHVVRGETLGWAGAAIVVVAVLLLGRTPSGGLSLNSPIPADAASLARGEAIYTTNCVRCHGESLRGDGPDAAALGASDLALHVPHHSDREHFTVIANGRGAMPAWEGNLTEDEIWHVINYLRAEAEAAALSPGAP